VALLAAIAMAGPQGAGAAGSIDVYGVGMSHLGSFSKLSCKIVSGKGKKRFVAKAKDGDATLDISLNKFSGYKQKYNIRYGDFGSVVGFRYGGGASYLSVFEPDGGGSKDAGYVTFPKNKKGKADGSQLHISALLYSSEGTFAVAVGGTLSCSKK